MPTKRYGFMIGDSGFMTKQIEKQTAQAKQKD